NEEVMDFKCDELILRKTDADSRALTTYRYLQAFPVDFIKIDKSFVQMASVDEISGHIVDNIVELARKPGLSIVAEGVETQEQADLMIGKGVHFLQGYLYSPPVPGNKFISEWVMKAGG
ncbi:EAL domain-containing protein, partial [Escherichia coli]